MLEPDDRRLLFEALRPPESYTLNCGVGTTFSLDLLALLTVPLAYTLFDWGDDEDPLHANPLALLEAIRGNSDKLHIFCQGGRITVPTRHQHLFGYFEDSVIQVTPSSPDKVFHPKVWILRFTAQNKPVLYRLLCMSRNLTFDSSWDTLLVLDGELFDRTNAFAVNHPLADFVTALPGLAIHPVPPPVKLDIEQMGQELRRVKFELPEGFDDVAFFPLGIEGARSWPFQGRIDRILVISPFISAKCLLRLTREGDHNILVSRVENLAVVGQGSLEGFERVKVLSAGANLENSELESSNGPADVPFSGLHAKLYVADAGWQASLWTGSANATDGAFSGNVEFLVRLRGSKSRFGVDAVLGQGDDKTSFSNLLQDFAPPQESVDVDPDQEHLEQQVEDIRRALVRADLIAKVESGGDTGSFKLQIWVAATLQDIPREVMVQCWPITLQEERGIPLNRGQVMLGEFPQLSFEALTSFFAFKVTASNQGKTASVRFVLNLPLEGAPSDRKERILRSFLHNRGQTLQLLLLLLSDGEAGIPQFLIPGQGSKEGHDENQSVGWGFPLFESMVRALDRDPAKLEQVARLVEDLRKTPEGQGLLPEEFDAVWQPIWTARERLRR
ncbi:MAG: phospholipase D family protein [Acidobacteriia bacterium]|nr:phospholipase D family protein [Terriglobia bacterium]